MKRRISAKSIGWMSLIIAAAGIAGCSGMPQITDGQGGSREKVSQAGFFYELADKPWCSADDAARGLLLLLDGQDPCTNFQQRIEKLADRGLTCKLWHLKPNEPITKGQVAYMICKALDIRGGLTMLLFGPSDRYCYRELVWLGIMEPGTDYQPMTGPEFVGVISAADEYRKAVATEPMRQFGSP